MRQYERANKRAEQHTQAIKSLAESMTELTQSHAHRLQVVEELLADMVRRGYESQEAFVAAVTGIKDALRQSFQRQAGLMQSLNENVANLSQQLTQVQQWMAEQAASRSGGGAAAGRARSPQPESDGDGDVDNFNATTYRFPSRMSIEEGLRRLWLGSRLVLRFTRVLSHLRHAGRRLPYFNVHWAVFAARRNPTDPCPPLINIKLGSRKTQDAMSRLRKAGRFVADVYGRVPANATEVARAIQQASSALHPEAADLLKHFEVELEVKLTRVNTCSGQMTMRTFSNHVAKLYRLRETKSGAVRPQ